MLSLLCFHAPRKKNDQSAGLAFLLHTITPAHLVERIETILLASVCKDKSENHKSVVFGATWDFVRRGYSSQNLSSNATSLLVTPTTTISIYLKRNGQKKQKGGNGKCPRWGGRVPAGCGRRDRCCSDPASRRSPRRRRGNAPSPGFRKGEGWEYPPVGRCFMVLALSTFCPLSAEICKRDTKKTRRLISEGLKSRGAC